MLKTIHEDAKDFEQEVIDLARVIHSAGPGEGGSLLLDSRERDFVFEDKGIIHYYECTTSRKIQKIESDAQKMVDFKKKNRKAGKPIILKIVTKEEPTAEQKAAAGKHEITILSINELKRYIFDVSEYLAKRGSYPFGSSEKQDDGGRGIYQEVRYELKNAQSYWTFAEILNAVKSVNVLILTGDYGAGKSVFAKVLFEKLCREYRESKHVRAPLVINLRDHQGQEEVDELILRHATKLGLSNPSTLIYGLNANMFDVILDGYDELGGVLWTTEKPKLTESRKRAVSVIKKLIDSAKGRYSVLVTGREHYFDSKSEAIESLGLPAGTVRLGLSDFTDDEARAYLEKAGIKTTMYTWFPRRPLLLAYLCKNKDFIDVFKISGSNVAEAWNSAIDLICEREAKIHTLFNGPSLRRYYANLANHTRELPLNTGPISVKALIDTFVATFGEQIDDATVTLLGRLPGLGVSSSNQSDREFMDDKLVDALRSDIVYNNIMSPYVHINADKWVNPMCDLGAMIVANRLEGNISASSMLATAYEQAQSRHRSGTLAFEIFAVQQYTNSVSDIKNVTISEAIIDTLDYERVSKTKALLIEDSAINKVFLGHCDIPVQIKNTMITEVYGASSESDAQSHGLLNCEIKHYDKLKSNSDIMNAPKIALSLKIAYTVLNKVYLKPGAGRDESALYRGLGAINYDKVNIVIEKLINMGLLSKRRVDSKFLYYRVAEKRESVTEFIRSSTVYPDTIRREIERLSI